MVERIVPMLTVVGSNLVKSSYVEADWMYDHHDGI